MGPTKGISEERNGIGDRGVGDAQFSGNGRGGDGINITPRRSGPVYGTPRPLQDIEQWREAVRIISQFSGRRDELSRYLGCLEDVLAMVGLELELDLMRVARHKFTRDVWNQVNNNRFNNIHDSIKFL